MEWDLTGVKQGSHEHLSHDDGDILVEFCAQINFRINNTFFDHDFKYRYTFINAQGQVSMIHCILTDRQFNPTEILDVRTLNLLNICSDHV